MRSCAAAGILASLLLAASARAANVPLDNVDTLVAKSDVLVVGQVLKVEPAASGTPADLQIPMHATLKILRGITTTDAKPLALGQLVIEYPAATGNRGAGGNSLVPFLPHLAVGQIALYPLRRPVGAADAQPATAPAASPPLWIFVSEIDNGMILPVAPAPLNATSSASAKDFLYRELVGAFALGDPATVSRACSYVQREEWTAGRTVLPLLPLLEAEIHDEARWVDIAASAYSHLGTPRPKLAALRAGPQEKLASRQLIQLACSKAAPDKLDDRLLGAIVAHQDTLVAEGQIIALTQTLTENYQDSPLLPALERAALADARPGALLVVNTLLQDSTHPLAAPALAAARKLLAAPNSQADVSFPAAVALLVRLGTDPDFAFLLEQVSRAKTDNPAAAEAFLTSDMVSNTSGITDRVLADRVLAVCRVYIDVPTPLLPYRSGVSGDLRLCDRAGQMIQSASHQDFGLNPRDPPATRDQALTKIRAWLATQK